MPPVRKALPLVLLALWACARHACAAEDAGVAPRIVGGKPATSARYPYMASILDTSTNQSVCGATLIKPRVLLTSTGCGRKVRLHRDNNVKVGGRFMRVVHRVKSNSINLSLMLLDKPAKNPIKLPPQSGKQYPALKVGTPLTALGYGTLRTNPTAALHEVDLKFLAESVCKQEYPRIGELAPDMDGAFCAGNPGVLKNTCTGDEGGPLIFKGRTPAGDRQVGVALRTGRCTPDWPGLYLGLAWQRDYIEAGIQVLYANAGKKPSKATAATLGRAAAGASNGGWTSV